MAQYFSEWTATGIAKMAAFLRGGPALRIVSIAIGDGGGAPISSGATRLVREVYRGNAVILLAAAQADLIECTMRVPIQLGGWTIREVAVVDAEGDTLAIASVPPSDILLSSSGSTAETAYKVFLPITNQASVNLTIDGAVIYVSQNTLNQTIISHTAQPDPHPVYLLKTAASAGYAAKAHGHAIADTAGLQAALDAKQTVAAANQQAWPLGQVYFISGG